MTKIIFAILLSLFLIYFPPVAPTATAAVDYQLPYPGVLPNSPFYFLKALRDKITGILISDPIKKADFDISRTDVRISTAISLIDQKKDLSLAESTISKAENYFEEAIEKTRLAKKEGTDISEILKKLRLANSKHLEVITVIIKKLNKKDAEKFALVKKRATSFSDELKKIKN